MTAELSRRALNRATLDRQLLLERSRMSVPDAVDHLVGVQAQTPHTWYTGLWSRLEAFDPVAVGELLERRELVRVVLMRSTLHLVVPEDVAGLRTWVQPVLDRDLFRNQTHGKPIAGVDVEALVAAARAALADGPLTNKRLGEILAPHWPDCPPATLVYAVRNQLPLVQVPPRGVWGRSGSIAHTTAEAWLGERPPTPVEPSRVILRFLAAFGPASVRDLQNWSGLTGLREIVEPMRSSQLRTFRDEQGVELFDLPDLRLPDEQTPAPPRFISDFDNVVLSYADRTRITTEPYWLPAHRQQRPAPQLLLLDGFTAADWTVDEGEDAATLTVRPYDAFADHDAAAIITEGMSLLRFLAPGAASHEVVFRERPIPRARA